MRRPLNVVRCCRSMHELSIAVALIEIATEELERMCAVRATGLHVQVGPLSGVDRDALLFSFEVAAAGTALEGARLHIETPPLTVWCECCAAERTAVSPATRRCSECASVAGRVIRGEELELVGLEIERP